MVAQINSVTLYEMTQMIPQEGLTQMLVAIACTSLKSPTEA